MVSVCIWKVFYKLFDILFDSSYTNIILPVTLKYYLIFNSYKKHLYL